MNGLLSDGIKLLIVGGSVVLAFIGCIVLTIKVIAWVLSRFEKRPPALRDSVPAPAPEDDDEIQAAAIAAAIHRGKSGPG